MTTKTTTQEAAALNVGQSATRYDARTRLQDILSRITYKPGWTLTLLEPSRQLLGYERLEVRIQWVTTDVETLRPVTLSRHVVISEREAITWTEDVLVKGWLRSVLRSAEYHELDEWYKLDGKHVVDPHPDKETKNVVFQEKV